MLLSITDGDGLGIYPNTTTKELRQAKTDESSTVSRLGNYPFLTWNDLLHNAGTTSTTSSLQTYPCWQSNEHAKADGIVWSHQRSSKPSRTNRMQLRSGPKLRTTPSTGQLHPKKGRLFQSHGLCRHIIHWQKYISSHRRWSYSFSCGKEATESLGRSTVTHTQGMLSSCLSWVAGRHCPRRRQEFRGLLTTGQCRHAAHQNKVNSYRTSSLDINCWTLSNPSTARVQPQQTRVSGPQPKLGTPNGSIARQ